MAWYFIEPKTGKYVKRDGFSSFTRKYEKQLLDIGLDSLKNSSKKVVYKTGESLGNKIACKIVKPKHVTDENPRNVEEIFIVPEKRKQI